MAAANTAAVAETNWQMPKTSLKERNSHMFNNPLISDVSFSVKDSSSTDQQRSLLIPAHKYVLAISSPVFFALFYGKMPHTSRTVDLPDCDSESFLELLRFIYCEEVNLTGNNVMQVLYLSKKYLIPSLSEACTQFLYPNLHARNVFSVLPEALVFEEARLVEQCWEIIDDFAEDALDSEPFEDVSRDLLKAVLVRDKLRASELDILAAIERWAEKQCSKAGHEPTDERKKEVLGDEIINLVRFPIMPALEFAANVPRTHLLSKEDMCDVLLYCNGATLETPLKFSTVDRRARVMFYRRAKRFRYVAPNVLWNYGGQSDALLFSVDHDVAIHGVRLLGRRGSEYSVTLELYHLRTNSKMAEEMGKYNTEDERKKGHYGFDVIFQNPAAVQKYEFYEIRALIKGPKSRYGGKAQTKVTCDDVTFTFSTSPSSKNGTNDCEGQFPEILFL